MKECKKIIFVILAFLPIIVILYNCLGNMFSASGFDFVPLGFVTLTDGVLVVEPNTIADYVLTPLGLNFDGSEGGLIGPVFRFLEWCQSNAGIPINFPVIMVAFYNIYLFVIWLLDLIFEVLLWIPKRVKEVIRV